MSMGGIGGVRVVGEHVVCEEGVVRSGGGVCVWEKGSV